MLYESELPFMRVSWEIIGAVSISTTLFFVFAVGMGIRAQRRKPAIGREHIPDSFGVALDDFENGNGQILHEGEIWQAFSTDEIQINDRVRIIKIEDLRMTVEKCD